MKNVNWLFIVIGVIFIALGIVVVNQGNGLAMRCTEETIGTVVDNVRHDTTDLESAYFPIIEYQVGDRTISQESKSGQYPPEYNVGDKVIICYNPNNVTEYIIKGDSTSSFVGILAIVIGSIAVVVGLFAFFSNTLKLKNNNYDT